MAALLATAVTVADPVGPADAAPTPRFDRSWPTGNGSPSLPVGIAASPTTGTVYVTNLFGNRIERFDADGTFLGQFGTTGAGNGQFNLPHAVAVGPDGSVFVADTANNRIQKFTATGTFVTAWGTAGSGRGQFSAPMGVAVDPTGNVFVADSGNHRVQKFTSTGTYRTSWGREGTLAGRFETPSGIAVSADRQVYVVDARNDRVQQFTGTGTFQRLWGAAGTGNGRFQDPFGVAVDAAGTVYVTDTTANRVQAFSATGLFQAAWGTAGSLDGQFQGAWGVAVASDGTRLLVADKDNSRVQRFAPGLPGARPLFVNAFGTAGQGPGQMNVALAVAIGPSGNVYVSDYGAGRIERFGATGTFLSQWGTYGTGAGQFDQAAGVATDAAGNVYVADTFNHRVQKFTATGTFLAQIGDQSVFEQPDGVAVDAGGNLYVVDHVLDRVRKYNAAGTFVTQWGSTGTGNGQFQDATGIAADSAGNVYVADAGNHRIQKFTATGTYLGQWGSPGSGNGQFDDPEDIAIDRAGDGAVYVVDTGNHRIQKFTLTGSYLTQWGGPGSGDGRFQSPLGVAVNATGSIHVADTGNHRIQVFATGTATTPSVSLAADQSSVGTGEPIDYHVTIANTTADTLTGTVITDPAAPDCEGPVVDILPGATRVVDCTHNTGVDEAGPFANAATVSSDQSNAVTSNTVTTQVGPALTVAMTAPPRVMATRPIDYGLSITNNTAQALRGLRVTDSGVPACAGPVADLAPGATTTVNCSRPTTDADAGSVVLNVAGVDATATQAAFASAVTRVQGRITGTITGPGGPIGGAYVLALDRDFLPLHGDATTDAAGAYSLGVDPGRYYLAFLDPAGAHLAEYSGNRTNALDLTTADLTTVASGSGPATASASLAASGFAPPVNPAGISGTVTDANGPLAGVWVIAINGGVRSATRTNAAGQYTVGNLPPGATYLEFVDPSGSHALRWYHDDNGANPTPIPLVAGQVVTGANEVLPAYP